jgi:osmoprotectant transport system permease protein
MKTCAWLGLLFGIALATTSVAADSIVVGSKIFTEGYVLGEIAAQTLEASRPAVPVIRKLGMGSTGILFTSLNSGAIDVYSDYTGTLAEAILKNPQLRSVSDIRAALLKMGIVISEPLGFDNTYALAVREDFAQREGLHTTCI